ncbi:MAG: class E sortase [Candidatus Komeilibacteria bacterium]
MSRIFNKLLYVISVVSTAILVLAFIFSYQSVLAENNDLQFLLDNRSKYDAPSQEVTVQRDDSAGLIRIAAVKSVNIQPVIAANSLVVPKMKVNSKILEGKTTKTLNQGLWRIPGTSTPDKGGNMVIAAHRWKWLPSSQKSFYDIEKVTVGDQITVTWQGKEYYYQVVKTSYVKPNEVSILANTSEPRLTLFSCAPLFSTKYRYVVQATLVKT